MSRGFALLASCASALGLTAIACGSPPEPPPVDAAAGCTVTPAPGAEAPAGPGAGVATLPDGRELRPAGRSLEVPGFPLGLAAIPGTPYVVVGDSGYGTEHLRVIDAVGGSIVSEREVPSHFLGLAVSAPDGAGARVVYASNPDDDQILLYDLTADGVLGQAPRDRFPAAGLPAGLGLSADGADLVVALQDANAVVILDAQSGVERVRVPALSRPYQVAVATTGDEAYATLWGGGGVLLLDRRSATPVAVLHTGKNPTGLVLSGDGRRLWVANTDDDTVSIVDLVDRRVAATAPLTSDATALSGRSPGDLALSPDGERLYVAAGGANAVYAFQSADLMPLGATPVGWYPVSLAVLPAGHGAPAGLLVVANGKGDGPGMNLSATYIADAMRGTLSLVTTPSAADLTRGAQIVDDPAAPARVMAQVSCTGGARFPVPLDASDKTRSPIEHVILLVRENKTYDAVLGDLAGANGDPALTLFGEDVTPNLHALARRFANLDNFYSNAEVSAQGHSWAVAATSNDFLEKAWFTLPGYRKDLRPASDQLGALPLPAYGSFFRHLDHARVPFVVWGEIFGFEQPLGQYFDSGFPGVVFNLAVKDVDKVAYVLHRVVDEGFLPAFSYFLLPRDHTYGTTPGKPSPRSMVAENDLATGQLIEGLSKSALWPKTVVFLIEDDPQDGGDHVEAHRSPCLVMGPYARRGATVSSHFDDTSLYRTIELLLGVAPMNHGDGTAAPMLEAFTDRADPEPFAAVPARIATDALNAADAPLAAESLGMDFSAPDRARGLGRVLWRAEKGREPPWLPDED